MCKSFEESEIIIGLVAPVGVNLNKVQNVIINYMKEYKYKCYLIKLSELVEYYKLYNSPLDKSSAFNRIDTLMTAGNETRKNATHFGILSILAMDKIYSKRNGIAPLKKTAHIIRQFKHTEEVMVLRRVYSHGFFLLGIFSSYSNRMKYLAKVKKMNKKEAESLIERDQMEEEEYGQQTREVFHIADGFIDIDANDSKEQIGRILDLLFANPFLTPTKEEYGMFHAFASSLRSGDLSRQVGASIMSEHAEIISTGANEAPKFGGGLYWSDDTIICRDIEQGFESNEKRKNEIVIKIMDKIKTFVGGKKEDHERIKLVEGKKLLKSTGILEITEYGRSVHAEMEALLHCSRTGVSPRGATLYTTTFPCHNCARHIVASGITKVIFVEPYPKSLAPDLHADSIDLIHESMPKKVKKHKFNNNKTNKKVIFKPFVGVSYRRYFDLFSIKLIDGRIEPRKINGKKVTWRREYAILKVPLLPLSYIEREKLVLSNLQKLFH